MYERPLSDSKGTDYIMNINKTPYEPHSEIQGQDSTTLKDPEQVISAVSQEDGPSRFLS